MQTVGFDLTDAAWTEILNGDNALSVQVKTQSGVYLHFNDSADAPAIGAASVFIESWPPRFDFECATQTGQSRVWARARSGAASIVVVRKTA